MRRQRQREAAEDALANSRALSAEGLAIARRMLDALAVQHATLSEQVLGSDKELANLSGA
jgi:hypothetical protein